jgi:hypothetical protein
MPVTKAQKEKMIAEIEHAAERLDIPMDVLRDKVNAPISRPMNMPHIHKAVAYLRGQAEKHSVAMVALIENALFTYFEVNQGLKGKQAEEEPVCDHCGTIPHDEECANGFEEQPAHDLSGETSSKVDVSIPVDIPPIRWEIPLHVDIRERGALSPAPLIEMDEALVWRSMPYFEIVILETMRLKDMRISELEQIVDELTTEYGETLEQLQRLTMGSDYKGSQRAILFIATLNNGAFAQDLYESIRTVAFHLSDPMHEIDDKAKGEVKATVKMKRKKDSDTELLNICEVKVGLPAEVSDSIIHLDHKGNVQLPREKTERIVMEMAGAGVEESEDEAEAAA